MDKEAVVSIHNGILLSYKKNAFESVLVRWMNLEPIIQSKVSHKEKDKYCILAYIYRESRRVVGEGNGNPFQYLCLENPMEGET